jgi:hypothetical protein
MSLSRIIIISLRLKVGKELSIKKCKNTVSMENMLKNLVSLITELIINS